MGTLESPNLSSSTISENKDATSSIGFDLQPSRYMAEMEDFDITEAQKIELLETLWSIMRSMVELGFDMNICERILLVSDEAPAANPDDV